MKCMNRIIKTIFIITLVFIFSSTIKAGVSGGRCLSISKESKDSAAHFDIETSTCTWGKVVGYKSYPLNRYPSGKEAMAFGDDLIEDQVRAIQISSAKEAYEQMASANSLTVTRCDSGGAFIATEFHCDATWGAANSCNSNRYCYRKSSCCTMRDKHGVCIASEPCGCEEWKCKYTQICRCGTSSVMFSGDESKCCPHQCATSCTELANKPQWDRSNNKHSEYKSALDDPSALIDSYVRLSDGDFVRVISDGWVAKMNGGTLSGDVPTIQEFHKGLGYVGNYQYTDGNVPITAVDSWDAQNVVSKEMYESLPAIMFANNQTTMFNFYKHRDQAFTEAAVKSGCEGYGGDQYGSFQNCSCSVNYKLMCPIYTCTPRVVRSGVCTPKYKATTINADMYGVNPSLSFTVREDGTKLGKARNELYQIDNSFDYRTCNTSYQSEECGYANILIESEYIKKKGSTDAKSLVDYQTINLAMRLYGAHVSSRGYIESAGLGTTRTAPGTDGSCDWDAFYTFVPSAYKLSRNVAMEFLEHVTRNYSNSNSNYAYGDYVSPAMFANDNSLTFPCSQNHIGAMCHIAGGTVRERKVRVAVGLFFNTIMGNSKMKEHRDELFGYTINRVQTAELVAEDGSETTSRLVVDFGDINVEKIETGVVYNCNNLGGMDPQVAEHIRRYCGVQLVYSYVKDGVLHEESMKPEYCSGKHALRCTTKKISVAVCNKYRTSQTVRVTYPDEVDRGGPIKMIACNNPDKLQTMFGIAGASETPDRENTETYEITSYECNKTFCHDLSLREKDASAVPPATREEYDAKKSGDVSIGFVKDPSLKCILNASADNKLKYDFSELFGVNTNFCRVYCSDEVEYYLPDRETIKDGRSLKYDISIRSYLKDNKNHMISNVVKEKRTCVSEIYYNDFPRTTNWASIYGFSLKDQGKALGWEDPGTNKRPKAIYTWTDLYNVLHSLTGSSTSGASGEIITENLNEIIYDLYNCNLYSAKSGNSMFERNKIKRPRQRAFGRAELNENVYDYYVDKEYSINNVYGLHGGQNSNNEQCSYDKNTGKLSCMGMRNIAYAGGSLMVSGERIGGTGKNNNIEIENTSTATLEKVRYCRNSESTTGECFGYEEGTDKGSVKDLATYNYERMDDKTKSYHISKNRYVDVPINDYALFSVITEVGFYNKTKFQAEPSTGKVSKIKSTADSGRFKVDDYTYPVSKNAYSMCKKAENYYYTTGSGKYAAFYKPREYSNCKVTHSYDHLNTYHRMQFSDNFFRKINEYQASTYFEVTGSQTQCSVGNGDCLQGALDIGEYRNVNRADMFPYKVNYEYSNWDTSEGERVRNEIESADKEIFVNDDYLEYSFELTPQQLKNIRTYNKSANDYVEVEVDQCELTADGKYLNCRSVDNGLLSEIRKGQNNAAGTSYATILNDHDGSDLFYRKN